MKKKKPKKRKRRAAAKKSPKRKRRTPVKKSRKGEKSGAVVTAIKPAALVKLFRKTRAGAKVTRATIKAEIKAGFKPNKGGTIDLVKFTAWLLRRHGYGDE